MELNYSAEKEILKNGKSKFKNMIELVDEFESSDSEFAEIVTGEIKKSNSQFVSQINNYCKLNGYNTRCKGRKGRLFVIK